MHLYCQGFIYRGRVERKIPLPNSLASTPKNLQMNHSLEYKDAQINISITWLSAGCNLPVHVYWVKIKSTKGADASVDFS